MKSYKSGFERVVGGENDGMYIRLDFAMLVDLSIIDMLLRNELLPMALDIEHFAKVRLINALEHHGDDGYKLVEDFLEKHGGFDPESNEILREIERGRNSPYVSDIVASHPDLDYPVWEFVEVITFGTFLRFYRHCAEVFGSRAMTRDYYCLQSVKGIRNGCAHNNCIISNMRGGSNTRRPQHVVVQALSRIGVSKEMRDTKLSNERFQQIATAFYLHRFWSSAGILKYRAKSLWNLMVRMGKHAEYYANGNDQVKTGFAFLEKMIRGWYPQTLFCE